MSQRRERVLDAWNGAWGQGDLTGFESLLAPGYVRRSKTGDEDYEQLRQTIQQTHEAFPDLSTEILHLVEDGDQVAIHWRSHGTHSGSFLDVAATDRSVTVSGASFLRFEDGLIAEEWVVWDPREFLAAIGIWHLGDGAA
jgi:steroid delta-isomerase-like uncharacterized protein